MRSAVRLVTLVAVAGFFVGVGGACSDDDDPDRITRIEGPAQVDDDVSPEPSPDE